MKASKTAARLGVGIVWAVGTGLGQAQTAPPSPPRAAASSAIVNTKNFAYAPSPLEVRVGDVVVFKNSDLIAHTVSATDKSFDSGDMPQGATWKHAFTSAGTYTYTCAYHSYMKATVLVKP